MATARELTEAKYDVLLNLLKRIDSETNASIVDRLARAYRYIEGGPQPSTAE